MYPPKYILLLIIVGDVAIIPPGVELQFKKFVIGAVDFETPVWWLSWRNIGHDVSMVDVCDCSDIFAVVGMTAVMISIIIQRYSTSLFI
jgi:hypothetical protein